MLSGIQLEKIAWLLDMQCIATDVGMLGKMCRAAPIYLAEYFNSTMPVVASDDCYDQAVRRYVCAGDCTQLH